MSELNQDLGHLKITPGDTDEIIQIIDGWLSEKKKKSYCIPINLTKYVLSKKDEKLSRSINDADLVIADGIPIKWLSRRAKIRNVHRVTGVDLSERLLAMAKEKEWSLFFLGASPENVQKAVERVKQRFDNPSINFRDGYFKDEEVPGIIDQINVCKPDILFLGLGMPQKEYFLVDHHEKLEVPFSITVGGAIDIWAEAKKRTAPFIQKMGLEWFVRSMYDSSKFLNIVRYGGSFCRDLVFPNRLKKT